uniref:hypothetical protein n=1 Tax=Escherichia coli TaxID=562 RepID=UPI00136B6A54
LAEQAKGLARLVELGYTFVTFNALHLVALFDREGVSPSFNGLVAGLGERETSSASALSVATDFFNLLMFTHTRPARERGEAIDAVLDALAVGCKPEDVADVFRKEFLKEPGGQILSLYMFHLRLERWLQSNRQRPDQRSG